MPSFGYTTLSSGSAAFSNTHVGTLYENDSGSDVYVDQIELKNVSVARTATFQCAIYTDGGGFPSALLGVSDILSSVALGINAFPFPNPVGVSSGQSVWLFIRTDSTLNVLNAVNPSGITAGRGPGFGYGGGSGFPTYFQLGYGPEQYSVPLVASGSSTSPSGDSDLQTSLMISEPLAEGTPPVKVPLLISEPLAEGSPNVQVNLTLSEPLSEGYPNVQVSFCVIESIHPVPPELPMATTPFPGFGNSTSTPSIPAAKDPFNTPLPGLAMAVHKKPMFKTNIKEAASGVEVSNSLAEYPRWDFTLEYEFLEDRTGANSSLKTILGFFLSQRGAGGRWLFKDPDDYLVEGGDIATADGVTTEFPFLRNLGGFPEKIGQIDTANDIVLYADGVIIDPSDYTITLPNLVVFDSAPADGVELTADFQFFFVCRFVEDEMDFEKFSDKLWSLQECSFRSIIQ